MSDFKVGDRVLVEAFVISQDRDVIVVRPAGHAGEKLPMDTDFCHPFIVPVADLLEEIEGLWLCVKTLRQGAPVGWRDVEAVEKLRRAREAASKPAVEAADWDDEIIDRIVEQAAMCDREGLVDFLCWLRDR